MQISSDEIVARAKAYVQALGLPPTELLVAHEKYRFVRKEWIAEVCPHTTHWANRQSDILPRPVTIAVFPSSGPAPQGGEQSSHFREDDWHVKVEEL